MAQSFEYTPGEEELYRLHRVELELMDEFVRICEKYDLDYFLDHGTALGAVRHGGFIPWDDDMDVAMLREDYDKFLEAAQKELGSGYFVQTHETEPAYINFHLKIRIENTFFPQRYTENFRHRGIQMDIFPLDNLPGNRKQAERWVGFMEAFRKLHDFRAGGIGKRKSPVKKMLFLVSALLPLSFYRFVFDALCRRFNRKDMRYVTCLSYGSIRKNHRHFYDREDLLPTKLHRYEDRQYRIMNHPDAYLKTLYGDYWILPPEDKRGSHIYGKILFDSAQEEKK